MSDPFGEARGLLAEGPDAWGRLRNLIHGLWEAEALPEGLVAYCVQGVSVWPDDVVRALHMSWLRLLYEGRVPAVLALCNELELCQRAVGDGHLAMLARSPHVQGLRKLVVARSTLGERGARALAESPYLTHLRRLHLRSDAFDERTAHALAPLVARLEALGVEHSALDEACVRALLAGPMRLRELSLRGNLLGEAGARALFANPHLSRLQTLDVGLCHLETLDGLAGAAFTETLASLNVGYNLELEDLHGLINARLPSLRALTLREIGASRSMWEGLYEVPWRDQLEALDLGNNERVSVMRLAFSPGLLRLNLQDCGLRVLPDLYRLTHTSAPLRWLRLSQNDIGDGLGMLVPVYGGKPASWLKTLETFELHACGPMEPQALERVLEEAPNLRELVVSSNELGEEHGRVLGAYLDTGRLQRLDASNNDLSARMRTWLKEVGAEYGCVVRV